METIEIEVEPREGRGKGAARALRRLGKVPAVLYGPRRDAIRVVLDSKDFETRVGSLTGSHLIRLKSSTTDIAGRLALVKELQRHPVSSSLVHADLYEVDVDTKIRVDVPLQFVGKCQGVELGGILQPIRREIEVLCLPTEIPDFLEVDVTALGIHDVVHVRDLKAPKGAEIQLDGDLTVVTVQPPIVEEVKVEEGEGAVAAAETKAPEGGGAAPAPKADKD